MYKLTILVILIRFASCFTITPTWQVPASYIEEIPPLPSSFSAADRRAVANAISEAINCTQTNPLWNSTQLVGSVSSGIPKCLVTKHEKHANVTKALEEQLNSATSCSRVPKIIHQQWKEKKIPLEWIQYHRSWQKHNPDWHILVWRYAFEFVLSILTSLAC